jgi:small-conductance mechanosensitive channel
MAGLVDAIDRHTRLGKPLSIVLVVFALFLAAWIVSVAASSVAAAYVDWTERRRQETGAEADTGVITGIRQRETAIALIATTLRYSACALALVLSLAALSGAHALQTVVGASFLAIIVAFAAQRFLTDVIAGLLMFFEGWFRIGDTVAIDPWNARGVVEAVSLRSLTIRSITGEILHVPNSQVVTLRVFPRGYYDVQFELFTTALAPGRELVEEVARIVPAGPTQFVRRPVVAETEELDDDLYRITARCAVSVGREWLADDLLPALIKERAGEGLIVHGPIITYVNEQARLTFERALAPGGVADETRARRRRFGAIR